MLTGILSWIMHVFVYLRYFLNLPELQELAICIPGLCQDFITSLGAIWPFWSFDIIRIIMFCLGFAINYACMKSK